MSALLEELLEVIKRHLGTFFRSYNVKTDLETAYSRISAVRLTIDNCRYVDVTLVEDATTRKRKQACHYIVDGKDVWGFNDVPHHRELSSFPYHEHLHGKPKETKIRTIDEALTFIERKANTLKMKRAERKR